MRVEFIYDKLNNITRILLWKGMIIYDKFDIPGAMSSYSRKKFKEELLKKYAEIDKKKK